MDINIRQAVINNLSNSSKDDIMATINDSVSTTEEKVLPGLGVLLEVFWKKASSDDKNYLAETIANNLKQ